MPGRRGRDTQSDIFAVRDNTRTPFVSDRGFVANTEYKNAPKELDITDSPMGWMPLVGDVLQGGQVFIDATNKHWGRAALNAGLLLVPNVVEKPVKQLLKNGTKRVLRSAPTETISLADAMARPYRGQNFVIHGVDHAYMDDVLKGETRAMSPSLAVNRVGDVNLVPDNVGFYGDHYFVGDKSWLDNGYLFNGDGLTPTVGEIFDVSRAVPSGRREEIANELWKRTERELKNSPKRIAPEQLDRLHLPPDGYFEAKYQGLLPLEKSRYALFPEPGAVGTVLEPEKQEAIIRAYERLGLPVTTYNDTDDKLRKLITLLREHPEWRFREGGKIHIKQENRGKFTALKKRTGKSASWFKAHGTPAQKKMAVFALNARKWKHADGGLIERMNKVYQGDVSAMLDAVRKARG